MKNLLFIFLLCSSVSTFAQGPWVYDKGAGYSHISLSTLANYDKVFEGNFNNLVEIEGTITEVTAQSYTEIGLGKKFGLTASIPLVYLQSDLPELIFIPRTSGNLLGLGNTEIALKYNFINSNYLLSGILQLGLPLGRSDETTGLQTAYDAYSITPMISLGKGMSKSYIYTYFAFEYNTHGYNHNGRFGAEYGHKFYNKFWTIFSFNLEEPLFQNTREFAPNFQSTRLFINDQYYNSFALKLIYEINDSTGINGSANLISVRANNLPFKSPLTLGFYKKWK